MASNINSYYDLFLSYPRDVKKTVTLLYSQLTQIHGLRCWMDDFELGSGDLNESKN